MAKDYNGFTAHQRQKAYNWVKGRKRPGPACDACGQGHGHRELHSEDYSEPYGDHIGEFTLCYPCHMVIHCRFRNPQAWDLYREKVRLGHRLEVPFQGRDWYRFTGEVLRNPQGLRWVAGPPPLRAILDEIAAGLHDPRSKAPRAIAP